MELYIYLNNGIPLLFHSPPCLQISGEMSHMSENEGKQEMNA